MSELSTIHLNVPAAVKAAWVAQSRAAGMRLTDWVLQHMEKISIAAAVAEIGSIAESLTDHPLYFRSAQTREGVEAMIQAAQAFAAAESDVQRADAALWVGEAYLIFSSSLPDTGSSEQHTGWGTAHQIKKLLGAALLRGKVAYGPNTNRSTTHEHPQATSHATCWSTGAFSGTMPCWTFWQDIMQNDAPQMTPEQLIQWRKSLRKKPELTQEQAANLLGISRANYRMYEADEKKRGIPHMMALACNAVANSLGPWQPTAQPADTPKAD